MSYPASIMSRSTSRHLLIGVAGLAIAAATLSQPAVAQSFKGTPSIVTGGGSISTAPNNTTVNIDAPVNVINWRPDDTTGTGTILFQPSGTTALFRSANFQDFAVLNRILPVDINGASVITRPIRFDGTVNSQFGGSGTTTAGSIWFYTPGGIILGASSAFNVGSLVLSTSDINPANVFVGNNGTINFTGTPNPASAITIQNGAQVNALINGSSYVALVAPRIVQNGTIQVDGSAALVGAEAVDITMDGPSGLFDITVSTGTSDANGVVHGGTGTTSGPASGGAGDPQRIYMMAIPKNTAISMLVNGNVGYTPAATATVQNGEVILSAGYDIVNGSMDLGEHATPVNAVPANITIGETSNASTSFTSRVIARASGDLLASPGAAVNGLSFLAFSGSAFLFGDRSSVVEASNNTEIIGVGGDLFVSSRRAGQGGNAAVRALGGLIGVGGDLTVDASSLGFSGQTSGISLSNSDGGNGRGGNASLSAVNGILRITGATQVSARGIGGYGTQSMGTGYGGTATVNLSGTATQAQLTGGLGVQGGGYGILSYLGLFGVTLDPSNRVNGGNGVGGSASVSIDDINQLTLPILSINGSGNGDAGGIESDNGGGNGGSGTGGTASFTLNNEALVLPDLTVDASGFGGNGGRSDDQGDFAGTGGAGVGGTATITLAGTASFKPSAGLPGGMAAVATGTGGDGGDAAVNSILDSGSGGAGTGGTASIAIGGASQVNVATIAAYADATSGHVGIGSPNFGGTGVVTGGNASIAINTSSTVDADFLSASANAVTFESSRTANANAGTANITVSNGTVTLGEISVTADALIDDEFGQNVGSVNGMLTGNTAGGAAILSVTGGALTATRAEITSTAVGVGQQRDGVADVTENSPIERVLAGGTGTGNNATFAISGGSASFAETLLVDASGRGGNGYINADSFPTQPVTAGAGGAGVGGTASLNVTGGLLSVPIVDLKSEGIGGNGGDFWGLNAGNAGAGGNGTGGISNFTAGQDIFTINALTLSALGSGGIGGVSAEALFDTTFSGYGNGAATGGVGGTGRGGRALLALDFDPVVPSLIIDTSGTGGIGGLGLTGGAGGNGFGGSGLGGARLALNFGDLTVDALIVRSNGTGGNGGQGTGGPGGVGGNGTGGDADLLADGNGSNLTTLDVLVQANGLGGNGGTSRIGSGAAGGNAIGGNARLTISNAATGNLGATVIEARADGGTGGTGPSGLLGGNGGNAIATQ
jgi:filamentous hemagglutinin family protein